MGGGGGEALGERLVRWAGVDRGLSGVWINGLRGEEVGNRVVVVGKWVGELGEGISCGEETSWGD